MSAWMVRVGEFLFLIIVIAVVVVAIIAGLVTTTLRRRHPEAGPGPLETEVREEAPPPQAGAQQTVEDTELPVVAPTPTVASTAMPMDELSAAYQSFVVSPGLRL